MDVWFDSGCSWAGVADARESLTYPVDLYLEGSDQHRGWFQSSLLTSVAANGVPPYRAVLTHGFVLDEKGFKMSKSVGNVIDPRTVIEGGKNKKQEPGYGADVLRMWVASVNYATDVCIGPSIIKQTFEQYRKLRNTFRYLLGNLHDFEPSKHAVPEEQLPEIDRYLLGLLSQVLDESKAGYDDFQFARALNSIQQFVVTDLSNWYLDVAKDRLYISAPDEPRRRSCQTVLAKVTLGLAQALAPLLPHLCEDVWLNLPFAASHKSVFQAGWPTERFAPVEGAVWEAVRQLRDEANKCIEQARNEKQLGASLEARVLLHTTDEQLSAALGRWTASGDESNDVDELGYFLLTSQVELVDSAEEVAKLSSHVSTQEQLGATIGVARADGKKCERCWHYSPDAEYDADYSEVYPGVCKRCASSLSLMGFKAASKFAGETPVPA